jgi:parallel beta-helix repeat protein
MSHELNRISGKLCLIANRVAHAICLTSLLGIASSATAAVLCVNPAGTGGCYSTISKAVTAAASGDTITVAPGRYRESVHIEKSLSLVGANNATTTIEATGYANGVYIDGFDSPTPLNHVVVSGFTVYSARFEGILVQNASYVTISNNLVFDNDLALNIEAGACTGQPAFETSEGDDCGEGIHLMGVDHSTVSGNDVHENSGGILISDETAPNHDNAVIYNLVHDNAYDCGITLASHPAYVKKGTAPLAFGIYHNTIASNKSSHNGYGSAGGGAGVGLFAPGPGNSTTDNSVVGNILEGNSLPGVAIHNHAYLTFPNHPPNPDVDDNTIIGNYIAANAGDSDLPTTVRTGISILGTTPITGLVIANNTIEDEDIGIATNSASSIDLHLNNLYGIPVGVDNLNTSGSINATQNWWGCAAGPGETGCSTITGGATVITLPWLAAPAS